MRAGELQETGTGSSQVECNRPLSPKSCPQNSGNYRDDGRRAWISHEMRSIANVRATRKSRPENRKQERNGFPLWTWIKTNGFILGLFAVVLLAFIFPDPAARNGWLHPDLVQNIGIALIFFLQGISMPLEKVRKGAGNWKLHVIIQSFTFLIFPLVGLGFGFVLQNHLAGRTAGGPGRFSVFVRLTFHGFHFGGADLGGRREHSSGDPECGFFQYCRRYFNSPPGQPAHACDRQDRVRLAWTSFAGDYHADPLPFAAGVGLRPSVRHWVDANKKWVNRISNSVILFFVYSAFCDSVKERIWHEYGLLLTDSDPSLCRCAFWDRFLVDLFGLASGAAESRRRDCLLLLLR